MAKRFALRKIFILIVSAGLTQNIFAAAFQLFEQDGASIGNYHAGYAAAAEDASTSFYNPAGLPRIKNQQLLAGAAFILPDIRYRGTISIGSANPTYLPNFFNSNTSVYGQGGTYTFAPNVNYAAPLMDNVVLGLSFVEPFSLQTNYGIDSLLRYAATLTQLQVFDISPSLGVAFSNKISLGLGLDIEHISGTFQQNVNVNGQNLTNPDSLSKSSGNGNAYGYHFGAIYSFNPDTRIGISYHSQVIHHLKGTSIFSGPLANGGSGGYQVNIANSFQTKVALPPWTTVSIFHTFNPKWDAMGSVTYTQWSVFRQLMLMNMAGIQNGLATNNLQLAVQQSYKNSWNYSVGANYHATDKFMARMGLGFDQTPASTAYRNIQIPDSDRIAVALGGHYQASKAIGFDLAWTHFFVMNARINNFVQQFGDQIVTTNGTIKSNSDVYGLQVKWDIF